LIALGRSRAAYRARYILLSMSVAVVFAALSLSGCRNKKEEARQRAELTRALQQYTAQIGEHQKQASALRARFEKLPDDMQGVGPLRDDLHAIEEVLGVEDGRTKWLSGKLDEAFASGKKEEIEAVRNAIPPSDDATAQAILKLTHQLLPFERVASQRRFFEALDAQNARGVRKERPSKTGAARAAGK
jgi:outer membrane murein-binding lipoprotein Lpp